jgi:hypothetical protein
LNEEFILRILHIVFGVFWAGSAIFLAAILEPRLRALGPAVQGPVMRALIPVMVPAILFSATITIAAGITLALRLRWDHLDTFLDTGWGWAILIGFVASVVAYIVGMMISAAGRRMAALGASIEGRPPTPEEGGQLQHLSSRLTLYGRSNAVLAVIAVGSMASARFI